MQKKVGQRKKIAFDLCEKKNSEMKMQLNSLRDLISYERVLIIDGSFAYVLWRSRGGSNGENWFGVLIKFHSVIN